MMDDKQVPHYAVVLPGEVVATEAVYELTAAGLAYVATHQAAPPVVLN